MSRRANAADVMTSPLVSVIMPCYNGEKYIAEAVESVFAQTLQDFELIVVNDGSTDRSADILAAYGDRLVVVDQDNRGLPAARNSGIRVSRGKYLAFLDCDDYWAADFLRSMTEAMENTDIAVSYCGWQNVGASDGQPYIPPDYETDEKLHHFLEFASLWPVHAALVRRNALPADPPFDENLRSCEDYDLWLKTAATKPIKRVPQVLAYYRHHDDGQMTSNKARIARYNLYVKERFLRDNPSARNSITKDQVREYCADAFIKFGYRCLWGNDIKSAHNIFRHALLRRMVRVKDLKYALPSLLPYTLYRRFLGTRGFDDAKGA